MFGLEGGLQRCQTSGALRKALDRSHLGTVGLHREHQAGAHRVTVEQHRARAADTVLAAQMCAGQTQIFTKKSARVRRASTVRESRSPLTVTVSANSRMPGLLDRGRKHAWHKRFGHFSALLTSRVNIVGRIQYCRYLGPDIRQIEILHCGPRQC